jgi:hypothetical protein
MIDAFGKLKGKLLESLVSVGAEDLFGLGELTQQKFLVALGQDLVRHWEQKIILFPDMSGIESHKALQHLN